MNGCWRALRLAGGGACLAVWSAACARQTSVPPRDQVTGVWVLSAASGERLKKQGFGRPDRLDHRIELMANGDCRFRSYSVFISDTSQRSDEDYVNAADQCTWDTESAVVSAWTDRGIAGTVAITLVTRPREQVTRSTDVSLRVAVAGGRVVLQAPIGDPDQGRTIEYVRAE